MARRDFLPTTDDGLLSFTDNFARKIEDSAADFKLTTEEVEAYSGLRAEFASRLQIARDPDTKGIRATFRKSETKRQLMTLTRKIARQINGLMNVSDDQRQELGITVRDTPTSRPVPNVPPQVTVRWIRGRTVSLELGYEGSRGKAPFAAAATIFAHAGEHAPDSAEGWKYASATTRTRLILPFPPSPTGTTVWITAQWRNAKDESGPAGQPISINLPAGGPLPQEMNEAPMKLAA